jgi:hypothetical protein
MLGESLVTDEEHPAAGCIDLTAYHQWYQSEVNPTKDSTQYQDIKY